MAINFWKGLFENLGTRLNFSSAYHPQTDGQSEIANLTVLDLLKAYVTEVDPCSQWEKYLPLIEYACNNTVHTSTGKAPFEVIEGRPKIPLLLKVHGKIFAADEYSRDLKESFQKIKEAISITQQKQKAAANKHRRALAFKENDWVLLKFPKARLRHTTGKNPTGHQNYYAKLAKRYYGPFQILKPINEMAYQLKFPKHWLIHNAFHVSLLKPYKGEPPKEAIMEDPPEVEGQEEVLQPESVLRHEDKVLRNGKIIRWYLIKFKNYPFEDAKWMQGTQLKDSLHLVNAYNDSLEYGYRDPTEVEKATVFILWHDIGTRMGIRNIPSSIEEIASYKESYESKHMVYCHTNKEIAELTMQLLLSEVPSFIRPIACRMAYAFMDDRVRKAVGYPKQPAWLSSLAHGVLILHGFAVRWMPPRPLNWAEIRTPSGCPASQGAEFDPDALYKLSLQRYEPHVYEHGYKLKEVGAMKAGEVGDACPGELLLPLSECDNRPWPLALVER
ncbi:hypothetical protein L7F22_057535 [Adiantum nelumboides]|nr:hypothetical protein [Adiantum nelumboides]